MDRWAILKMFLGSVILIALIPKASSTLTKPIKSKVKRGARRPPGVAYDNKKMPEDCEVCRLITEEIESFVKTEEKGAPDEQEEKSKKRERRRKGKKNTKEQDANKVAEGLRTVCSTMKQYLPQDDLTKFRYISREILLETASLTAAATEPAKEEKVKHEYKSFVHPETARLEKQCKTFVRKFKKSILEWNGQSGTNSTSLTDFLCKERVLKNDANLMKCLKKSKANDKLWSKAFEHLSAFHDAAQQEMTFDEELPVQEEPTDNEGLRVQKEL